VGLTLTPAASLASLRQARTLVNGMSPRQRLIAIGGAVAVLVAIAAFVVNMAQPTYAPLYSGLAANDAQQVADQLSVIGVPYQLTPDGTGISVPQNDVDRARLAMASLGLPHSGQQGFSLFDKTNWSGSDFDEQVNYQRAVEGQLERTIESMQGVRSARVTLTMAHDSLFAAQDRPAKAAVVLSLAGGAMAPGLVSSIRHLVASAVDHLDPNNVAVINADGQIALSGGVATQSALEQQLEAKIVDTLAPIVGRSHVRASVTVAYDPTSSDDTQETYDPKGSVVLAQQTSSSGGGAATGAAGVPGTSSNLPNVKPAGVNFNAQLGLSGARGEQTSSSTYAVSRSVDHTIRPADTLQRISAAVLIDDASQRVLQQGHWVTLAQPRSPAEMQQLQSLAAAAIGLNAARGDMLTVSNLPFLRPSRAPEAPTAPGAGAPPAGWQRYLPAWLPAWAPAAGLGLIALLLFGLLGFGLIRRRPAPRGAAAAAAQQQAQIGPGQSLQSSAPMEVRDPSETVNITELLEADPEDTPPEVKQVLMLKMRLAEKVRREPAIASRLVQVWMNKRREESL
jgi:flagellar M-ring protein FliF